MTLKINRPKPSSLASLAFLALLPLLALLPINAGCTYDACVGKHCPVDMKPTPLKGAPEGPILMAQYFAHEKDIELRTWASPTRAWVFIQAHQSFDEKLRENTPEGPELFLLREGELKPTTLPPPPGLEPRHFTPLSPTEAGEERQASSPPLPTIQARFLPSQDDELLAIQVTEQNLRSHILRFIDGAWEKEEIENSAETLNIREATRELVILDAFGNIPAFLKDGKLHFLTDPPASLGVPSDAFVEFGPFDGQQFRVFWGQSPSLLCTGLWDIVENTAKLGPCMDFVSPYKLLRMSIGTVNDSMLVVSDQGMSGNDFRDVFLRIKGDSDAFDVLGEMRVFFFDNRRGMFQEDSAFLTNPQNPLFLEPVPSACAPPSLQSVSSYYRVDGSFGFVRCGQNVRGGAALMSAFQVDEYSWRVFGWDHTDGRQSILSDLWTHDKSVGTTNDPKTSLEAYTGPYSYDVTRTLLGAAPGFEITPPWDMPNLSPCSTVTGPLGPIPMNEDLSFTLDARENYSIDLHCDPGDGGPPLPELKLDPPPMFGEDAPLDEAPSSGTSDSIDPWRLPPHFFPRGTHIDFDAQATITQYPGMPSQIFTSPGGRQILVSWDDNTHALRVDELPNGKAPLTLAPALGLFITSDGQVISIQDLGLRGSVSPGQLALGQGFWRGNDGSVAIFSKDGPVSYVSPNAISSGSLLAATPSRLVILKTPSGNIMASDLDGDFSMTIFDVGGIYGNGSNLTFFGVEASDDGTVIALLYRDNLGQQNQLRIFQRIQDHNCFDEDGLPCQGPSAVTQFTLNVSSSPILAMDRSSGKLLYMSEDDTLTAWDPETGHFTHLHQGAISPFPGYERSLPFDQWGHFWWRGNDHSKYYRYDPKTGDILSFDTIFSTSPPEFTIHQQLIEGMAIQEHIYSITEDGLELLFKPSSGPSAPVYPLYGGRAFQSGPDGFQIGISNADGTALIESHPNLSASGPYAEFFSPSKPRSLWTPCLPYPTDYPDWVTVGPRGYVCLE